MNVEVVPAQYWHADAIAANPREADVAELYAQAHVSPEQAMTLGLRLARNARTGFVDGEAVCMFGVTPYSILRGWGNPWMVGSRALERMSVRKALLRHARAELADMQATYSLLFNFVDDRNERAHHWLRWLGFTLSDPMPYGPDGLPFRFFNWSA